MEINSKFIEFTMNLIFATNNLNKVKEIQQIIGGKFIIKTLADIGCTKEIDENGNTLKENASIKSNYVFKIFNMNCFADDTGLIVEELNGEPGVLSARYAGEQKNAKDNINLLLKNLRGCENKNAKFVTIISLILEGIEYFFEGELKGKIAYIEAGRNGFGYDPIFIPEGHKKTLAELSLSEKNKISHRALAFNKLQEFLNSKNYL